MLKRLLAHLGYVPAGTVPPGYVLASVQPKQCEHAFAVTDRSTRLDADSEIIMRLAFRCRCGWTGSADVASGAFLVKGGIKPVARA